MRRTLTVVRAFAAKRLKQARALVQTLGFYLTAALLLSIMGAVLFADLAEDVLTQDEVVLLDRALADAIHREVGPWAKQAGVLVSLLGSEGVIVIGVVAGTWYLLRRRWFLLLAWLAALVGGELLNLLLKQLFARPRPVFADPWVVERHYSFPSGHAMLSLITYGMLVYVLLRRVHRPGPRIALVLGAALLVALIGLSRIYLGVHYLSDVLAGFLAGGIWLAACTAAVEAWERRQRRPPQA